MLALRGDAIKGVGSAAAGAGTAKVAGTALAGGVAKTAATTAATTTATTAATTGATGAGSLLAGASTAVPVIAGGALATIGIVKLTDYGLEHGWQKELADPHDYVPDELRDKYKDVPIRVSNASQMQKPEKKAQEVDPNLAYQTYDPKTNKFTNVYISNVDVSGVEDLDNMITEIENAADSMR